MNVGCDHLEEQLPGCVVRGSFAGAPGWQAKRCQVAQRAQLAPIQQHPLLRALGQPPCMPANQVLGSAHLWSSSGATDISL